MANYGFEVLFFDIAGVAGLNGKRVTARGGMSLSATHPAPVLADGHHLRTARPTLSGFYPSKSDHRISDAGRSRHSLDATPSTALGRGRRILLRQGYGATSIVKVS